MNLQAVLGKLPSDKTQLLRGLGTPLLVLAALAMAGCTLTLLLTGGERREV